MTRFFYTNSIQSFLESDEKYIIGQIAIASPFSDDPLQKDAWIEQIKILQPALTGFEGSIFFEYSIPRMGQRIDVVLLIEQVLFVLEFKVGEKHFPAYAIDQVWDYALDLKNFHETSHDKYIVPILICTNAPSSDTVLSSTNHNDKLFEPVKCNPITLRSVIIAAIQCTEGGLINITNWEKGRYSPTPTIIEAAMALYNGHNVMEISRSDASAYNLTQTSEAISKVILDSKANNRKSICFVTGVPGSGKTLVGLNIATGHIDKENDLHSVFLSGNGPLVNILREALARDKVRQGIISGNKIKKGEALGRVKLFIQNVHHFRDECLIDQQSPPIEHVALFDEAQRAWNLAQTASFMSRKKNKPNFSQSEPEFLISCLDRHEDWAVIVCLVGGGQEINTGEAGIGEWIESLNRSFPGWYIYISPRLSDTEYGAGAPLDSLKGKGNVTYIENLHLAVSMRSFRAENVSALVKHILDQNVTEAQSILKTVKDKYPIALTRNLSLAKQWLKRKARGTERYGIVVSSQAERLKPYAIDVRSPLDPIHWFLDGKEDVRSSFYLEDVATEFDIQGLELDWCCITWDADFRYAKGNWEYRSFSGNKWKNINMDVRKNYLKNAYRVLLTRARQGMVIVVPQGDANDPTRLPSFYDPTFEYLRSIGFDILE